MCKAPLPNGGPGLPSPHLTYCFSTGLWALITGLRCQTIKFSKYSFANLVQHHVNRIGNQPLLGEEVVIFQSSPCECDLWFRFTSALLHSWGPLSSQVSLKLGSPGTGKGNFPGLLRGGSAQRRALWEATVHHYQNVGGPRIQKAVSRSCKSTEPSQCQQPRPEHRVSAAGPEMTAGAWTHPRM